MSNKSKAETKGLDLPSSPDLTKLEIAQSIRDYHHKALWEEEKHFTWFVSIIFSVNIVLITTEKLSPEIKSLVILFVSLIGMIVCLIALRVVRNESVNFQNALIRFNSEVNRHFDKSKVPDPPLNPNKKFPSLIISALRGRSTIRDSFQVVFIVFFCAFALIIIAVCYVAWTRRIF